MSKEIVTIRDAIDRLQDKEFAYLMLRDIPALAYQYKELNSVEGIEAWLGQPYEGNDHDIVIRKWIDPTVLRNPENVRPMREV